MTNILIIVTAYCACIRCTPGNQPTASGIWPREGITIAAPRHIPFGTKIHVPTKGWLTVQDRLAKRYDNRLDIFMHDHRKAKKWGIKTLNVWVMK